MGKNDTSRPGSRSPCNHPNCHVAASPLGWAECFRSPLPVRPPQGLCADGRCQEPQQASGGRPACLRCWELLL